MVVVTLPEVPGHRIVRVLGIVKGSTVRTMHLGKLILAGLRQIVGGEIKEYTEMVAKARAEAERRMIDEAEKLGANAIVNVRYTTSTVMGSVSEILAYGTAVWIEPVM